MNKTPSGQHILKFLYQKSLNLSFMSDLKNIVGKQKTKSGWLDTNTPTNYRPSQQNNKQWQTVRV